MKGADEVTWPVVINLAVAGRPAFVARGRTVAAARWETGLPVDDTDDGGPRQRRARRPRLASHKQIAADLLPEAGYSRAVDGGEGL
jgi:hypothetical protein